MPGHSNQTFSESATIQPKLSDMPLPRNGRDTTKWMPCRKRGPLRNINREARVVRQDAPVFRSVDFPSEQITLREVCSSFPQVSHRSIIWADAAGDRTRTARLRT